MVSPFLVVFLTFDRNDWPSFGVYEKMTGINTEEIVLSLASCHAVDWCHVYIWLHCSSEGCHRGYLPLPGETPYCILGLGCCNSFFYGNCTRTGTHCSKVYHYRRYFPLFLVLTVKAYFREQLQQRRSWWLEQVGCLLRPPCTTPLNLPREWARRQ